MLKDNLVRLFLAAIIAIGTIGIAQAGTDNGKGNAGQNNGKQNGHQSAPELDPTMLGSGAALLAGGLMLLALVLFRRRVV